MSSDGPLNEDEFSNKLLEEMQKQVDKNIDNGALLRYFANQLIMAIKDNVPPEKLRAKIAWDKFCSYMSYDSNNANRPEEIALGMAYSFLDDEIFRETGKHIDYFQGFYPVHLFDAIESQIQDDSVNLETTSDEFYEQLNVGQRAAFDAIMAAVNDQSMESKCFYLCGAAGTGKTYVYKLLSQHKKVLCSAPTGIASTLLPFGMTCHKAFDLPISESSYPPDRNTTHYGTKHAEMLRETAVILIDEITMLQRWHLEYVDKMLRFLMHKENIPFGGKVMLAGGDFRQLMPIWDRGSKLSAFDACVKSAHDGSNVNLWSAFQELSLTENIRAREDSEFVDFLDKIGNGIKDENGFEGYARMPKRIIATKPLHEEIFEELVGLHDNFNEDSMTEKLESISNKVIIATTNDAVDNWNAKILEMLPFEKTLSDACDKDLITGEIIEGSDENGQPPSKLILCKNSTIMLLRNMDVEKGLCNGTRFRYIEVEDKQLKCIQLTGVNAGKTVFLPRINLYIWDSRTKQKFFRNQYPVRLAFSITIHKAQGQTFDKVGVDLTSQMFTHGQMYVAFSRATKFEDLKVSHDLKTRFHKNVVDRRFFSNISEPCSPVKRMRLDED